MSPRKPPASSFDEPGFVKALAHPMRVSILARLQERHATPRELAGWLGASLGAVSYHVRKLHRLGLIELVATTPARGAIARHYRATERPRFSDESWAAASPAVKQAAVAATLATMSEYLHASADAGGFERDEGRLHRGRLRLDAQGWEAASEACVRAVGRIVEIEEAAAERIAKNPHDKSVSDGTVVLLLFEALRRAEAGDGG